MYDRTGLSTKCSLIKTGSKNLRTGREAKFRPFVDALPWRPLGLAAPLPYKNDEKKELEMHTCRKLKNDFSLLLLFPPNPLSRRNIFDFQINARGPPVLYIIHGASQVIVCHHSSPFQSFFRSPFYQRSSSIYFSNIFQQSKYMDEEKKSWIKTEAFSLEWNI